MSADIDCIVGGPGFTRQLLESAKAKSLMRVDGRGQRMESAPVKDNAEELQYGVDGICIRWPSANKDVYIYSDRYLVDHDSTEKSDRLVAGLKMDDWKLNCLNDSFGWADNDSNGPIYQKQGEDAVVAMYEIRGQFLCVDPINNVIASPKVVEA